MKPDQTKRLRTLQEQAHAIQKRLRRIHSLVLAIHKRKDEMEIEQVLKRLHY